MSDILVKIGADITDFSRKMAESQKKLTEFNNKNKETFDAFKKTGAAVTTFGATTAVALGGAVKTAVDFESAFAGVRKVLDASEAEFKAIENGIREMSKELPASAAEIAGVAEMAGQLGISKENLLDFTRTMVDLGEATNMEAEVAATSLARLANITQMPMEEIGNLGATIVDLGNSLATTESEITEMALRIAGAGSQVGLTEAQILAFSGALSSVGIEAEAGGLAFSRVMIEMANASATGSAELETFAKVAGMSSKEFKKAYEKDAAGTIITFIEGLDKMSKEGKNVFGTLEDLGLSEIRVRDALLRASGAGDLFRESIEKGNKAWQEGTALTDEAAQRYETTASQFAMLKNTMMDFAISIGQALLPYVRKATDFFKKLSERFNNLSDRTKRLIALGSAIAAAFALVIGPLLLLIGFIPQIIMGFKAIGTVFAAVTGPVGLTIAAIVGVIAALVIAYNKVEWFRDMVNEAWAWIKEASIVAFEAVRDFVILAVEEIVAFVQPILEKFRNFWDVNGRQILDIIKLYFGLVWEHIKFVIGHIKALFEMIWPIISGAVQIAWGSIKFVVESTLDFILGFIQTILAILRGDWEGAWETIKDTVKNIWENIKKFFEGVDLVQIGKDIIAGLISGMSSMVENVKEGVKSVGTKIVDTFKGWLKIKSPSRVMMALAKHIPGGAIKGMESMHGKLKSATARMADAMTPEVSQISMDYATPSGIHSSLASAINGTVDVNAREDIIAGAIDELRREMTNLRVEVNEKEFGRIVSDVSTEGRNQAVRNGGRRRI